MRYKLIYFWACILLAVSLISSGDPVEVLGSTEISLYFADTEALKLVVEKRTVNQSANTVEQVKSTIVELIKGPTIALVSTIPEETTVQEVFLDEKGCAYIDFSRAISQNHPGGTSGELVTIASIVNTLTVNFPEAVRKVQILVGGKEVRTLAGHIDISRPIFPFELE